MNGEAIEAAPPSVPGGDQRSNDLLVGLSQEQAAWVVIQESFEADLIVSC
jgi:hypothetical protein